MKIKKFWVVTKATKHSTLIDILFKADIKELGAIFRGGLHQNEVIGAWDNKKEALAEARKQLKLRKNND